VSEERGSEGKSNEWEEDLYDIYYVIAGPILFSFPFSIGQNVTLRSSAWPMKKKKEKVRTSRTA